jgi:hypothetical protein
MVGLRVWTDKHRGVSQLQIMYIQFQILTMMIVDTNKTWENAYLRDRAYYAAWWGNVYAMYYLNITNPRGEGYANRFHYLNSTLGASFQVDTGTDVDVRYDQLKLDYTLGSFLGMHSVGNGTRVNGSVYANPYQVSSSNFSTVGRCASNHCPLLLTLSL